MASSRVHYSVVINPRAGAVRRLGPEGVHTLLREQLGDRLGKTSFVAGARCEAACETALEAAPDALLMVGGDGSCRTAAVLASKQGIPVVFLPGGTMNVLPRKVWGQRTLEESIETIAAGTLRRAWLDIGLANDRAFFVAAAFGVVPRLTVIREGLRSAIMKRSVFSALSRLGEIPSALLRPTIRYTSHSDRPRRSSGLIATIGRTEMLLDEAEPALELGAFDCVSIGARSLFEYGRLVMAAATHADWRQDERIDTFESDDLAVTEGRHTYLTLDGEPTMIKGTVRLQYRRNGLQTIAPA